MLKTFVKIGAVNNLSDARYCAGMMVDQLGFSLDDDNMTKELFEAITGWVEGVAVVGEFDITDAHAVKEKLLDFSVSHVQVGDPSIIDVLADDDYALILKTDLEGLDQRSDQYYDEIAYFLLEDESISLKDLEALKNKEKIVLGSMINLDHIDEVLRMGFKGIAMRGGEELRPGVKDFDELAEILEHLEDE